MLFHDDDDDDDDDDCGDDDDEIDDGDDDDDVHDLKSGIHLAMMESKSYVKLSSIIQS
jgi:hypothetical protein